MFSGLVQLHSHLRMKFALWLLVGILILNPYTIIGPLGYYFALPFFAYSILKHRHALDKNALCLALGMILISLIGVASSFLHDIGQFEHLKVTIAIFIYITIGFGLHFSFDKEGLNFEDLVYMALIAISLNSLIILSEVAFPVIRNAIEFFLAPSGNIDWSEGFRYRGIASGGGASLSVLIPVAITFALYLYGKNHIGFIATVSLISLLSASLIFIGRTGVLLLPMVFLFFLFFNLRKNLLKILSILLIVAFIFYLSFEHVRNYLIQEHGTYYYDYAFGFMLDGIKGIENVASVRVIKEYLTVLPTTFPEILFGYGFYGGSDFEPWTDTGYNRMFLSVGYPFGILFYISFFLLAYKAVRYKPFIFSTIICILLIAEMKEPLLFTGYASRTLFILLAYATIEQRSMKNPTEKIET